ERLRTSENVGESEIATAMPTSGKIRASFPPADSIREPAPGGILGPLNKTTNRLCVSAVWAGEGWGNTPSTSSPTTKDTHPTTTERMALENSGFIRLAGHSMSS